MAADGLQVIQHRAAARSEAGNPKRDRAAFKDRLQKKILYDEARVECAAQKHPLFQKVGRGLFYTLT